MKAIDAYLRPEGKLGYSSGWNREASFMPLAAL